MNRGLQPRRVGRGVLTAPNFPDSESCLHGALGQRALPNRIGSMAQCVCASEWGLPMNRCASQSGRALFPQRAEAQQFSEPQERRAEDSPPYRTWSVHGPNARLVFGRRGFP